MFLKNAFLNRNYFIAFILGLFLVLWLASGIVISNDNESQSGTGKSVDEQKALTIVSAKTLHAELYQVVIDVRARTEPNRSVDLKAKIPGTVVRLRVEKGDVVKQGDTICELAVEDRQEKLAQADAELKKAEFDYSSAKRLQKEGFQSDSEIAQVLATLETARALYKRAEIDLSHLQIKAPFDGVVDLRPVEIGELMQAGDVCAQILDMDPLLISGEIAEANIGQVHVGSPVTAELLTGQEVKGSLRYIQRSANPTTRTFRLEAVVDNTDLTLLSGISVDLSVPVESVKAHLIPSSLLLLDDEGLLGVRILDESNIVKYARVELIADETSGIWVSGLPERVTIITVGQQYVAHGERVDVDDEGIEPLASPQHDATELGSQR